MSRHQRDYPKQVSKEGLLLPVLFAGKQSEGDGQKYGKMKDDKGRKNMTELRKGVGFEA